MIAPATSPSAQWAGQGLRFLLFGLLNTALTYAVYCVLVWVMPAQWAYALVFAAGIALAYWGNSRWVFRSAPSRTRAALYPLVYLAQYAINAGLLQLATARLDLGPRVGLAIALAVGTPLSFVLNRIFLTTRWRAELGKHALNAAIIAIVGLLVYYRGLDGWWQGDDLANLHRLYQLQQQGALWSQVGAWFADSFTPDSAFYRPFFMAQLALNAVLAGSDYRLWFAAGLVLHTINLLLIYAVVVRIGTHRQAQAHVRATLAAVMFACMPEHAEAVYWVLARADMYVCTLSLLGLWLWIGHADDARRATAWGLPVCFVLALGFKESAAVIALQMFVLAILWPAPLTRAQRIAVGICVSLVPVYFAWRWFLFGHALQVYADGAEVGAAMRAWQGVTSLPAWWQGLMQGAEATLRWPVAAVVLALSTLGITLVRDAPTRRIILGFTLASLIMVLATLANLGALTPHGEGGRLWYVPLAWLALALGVLLSSLPNRLHDVVATALMSLAIWIGITQTVPLLRQVRQTQHALRDIAAQTAAWSATHPGLTLLIVPDHVGPVVMARNAQGGLVLPPIQSQGYLHRVLPTLPQEIALRHTQFQHGLGARLAQWQPQMVDRETLARLLEPTNTPRWPDHYACWDTHQRQWRALPAPDSLEAARWIATMQAHALSCGAVTVDR